jgi:hypothetical protein
MTLLLHVPNHPKKSRKKGAFKQFHLKLQQLFQLQIFRLVLL